MEPEYCPALYFNSPIFIKKLDRLQIIKQIEKKELRVGEN